MRCLRQQGVFRYAEAIKYKEDMSMFSENLKAVRKAKGYTQEELAIKLNVVRQTVSKWEKGLSVPDADVLSRIADVLDTKVSVLLGGSVEEEANTNDVAEQLAKISEQLAVKNRRNKRIWKIIGIVLLVIVIFNIMMAVLYSVNTSSSSWSDNNNQSVTEIDGTDIEE